MKSFLKSIIAIHIFALTISSFAQSPVGLTVDLAHPQQVIPPDFLGLSYEMYWVRPDTNGAHYFNATDRPLANLFQTLGVKSLRVGGNSTDRPTNGIPVPADLDHLFGFARAAQARVIYTCRLRGGSLEESAAAAKYIAENYSSEMNCFAIGNEPNVFMKDYSTFSNRWEKFADAILAVYPGAKFCGPSPTLGKVGWIQDFVNDFAATKPLAFVTQHYYPGGSAAKVTDPAAARVAMLSPQWHDEYAKLHGLFAPSLAAKKIRYRLEEANSFWNAGARDVSDTFAASLWALDYLYWWAAHDAVGINFHTGDQAMIGGQLVPCLYAAFWKSPRGYAARPLAYAMTAFKLTSGGQLVPVNFSANANNLNLAAYAVRAADKTLFVTLINKENGSAARAAEIQLEMPEGCSRVETMPLLAPENQITAKQGITLGGAAIAEDGTWNGQWTPLAVTSNATKLNLKIPASSALLVKLQLGDDSK